MLIRQAKVSDVKGMHLLVKGHAQKGELLARPLSDLYEKIPDFIVAEEKGEIISCGALHVSWEDLAEVRTLIVTKKYQKKGIGAKMVYELERRAHKLGVKKVFALSFRPKFFKKIGYIEINRDILPHKVWRDCIKCPMFPDCGETALIKTIS
ncbi:MAG: N-acetyltransferase [Endomicrobiaceae bacterium]|nr:N-acetyltransferase [Endomicrobiaceae bacterium]